MITARLFCIGGVDLFVHDCTVFNAIFNKETRMDEYVSTQLHGVLWEDTKAVNVIKSGLSDADNAKVYIPHSVKTDKIYKSPKEFKTAPNGAYTLKVGDIVVKGIVEHNGPINKLFEGFDDVITITSVDTYDYSRDMQYRFVSGK